MTDPLESVLQLGPLFRRQDRDDLLQDGGAPTKNGHDQRPARRREGDDPDPPIAGVLHPADQAQAVEYRTEEACIAPGID